MNVGKSLRVALAIREVKQSELADRLGVTRQWISRLSNSNKASMDTISTLSKALGMSASEFLALGE